PEHERELPDRDRGERRRARAGSEERAPRSVRRGEPRGRDRGLRGRGARLDRHRFRRLPRAASRARLEPYARSVRDRPRLARRPVRGRADRMPGRGRSAAYRTTRIKGETMPLRAMLAGPAVLAAALSIAAPAAAQPQAKGAAPPSEYKVVCADECLREFAERFLHGIANGDATAVPLAPNVRYTENGVELAIGDALWATANGPGENRL